MAFFGAYFTVGVSDRVDHLNSWLFWNGLPGSVVGVGGLEFRHEDHSMWRLSNHEDTVCAKIHEEISVARKLAKVQ